MGDRAIDFVAEKKNGLPENQLLYSFYQFSRKYIHTVIPF